MPERAFYFLSAGFGLVDGEVHEVGHISLAGGVTVRLDRDDIDRLFADLAAAREGDHGTVIAAHYRRKCEEAADA